MEIFVGNDSGFCRGVKNAIDIANSCSGGCYTFGKLIHNETVLEQLKKNGIESIDCIPDKLDKKLIIRSHGVKKEVYKSLADNKIDYIDATCIFVKKIHKIVNEYHDDGYQIIIIGDSKHPEVIGINGWCDDSAIIIENEKQAQNITINDNLRYCSVSQTTFDQNLYKKIIKIIESRCKIVVNNNTICYTTIARQKQAKELSQKCDLMLVIGSKSSSNTKKLYDICKSNCCNTFYVQQLTDLKSVIYPKDNNFKLGIIAGASTPIELIEEVIELMSESQTQKIEKNTNKFEEMLNKSTSKLSLRAGSFVKDCKVISADEDGISINFGGKKDGFIDKAEVELDGVAYVPANYAPGMTISAIVIANDATQKKNDCIAFSKKAVEKRAKEAKESEELLKGNEFKAVIDSVVKGGLATKIGPYNIFIPASQIKIGYVTEEDLKKYVGKSLRLRVIKGKKDNTEGEIEIKKNKTIIASQRVILEEEKAKKEDALWETLVVDSIVTGKVKRFSDFGAFVSVNGFDCLAHISDLSHYSIKNPNEVLELNKTYEFKILKADRETQKVSLGYKQLQKKPYEIAFEKYPVGSVITGTVRSVFPYGAFVLIERDVDGLVPVSEIAHTYTKDATNVYKEGDEITAQVIKFEGNKITLSVKALLPQEEKIADVEVSENEYQEAKEKRVQRNARKFENKTSTGSNSAPKRRNVKREENEVSSWTSEQSSATFGDLFKNLNLDLKDED